MRDFLVFLGAGLGVYGARASFIVIVGDRSLPDWAERALRNVGPAVLAALITSLLLTDGFGPFFGDPAKVGAVAVSLPTAWKTRNFVWTFAVGLAAFWLIRAVTG
jgi:branched-subunit amino acid transport protein